MFPTGFEDKLSRLLGAEFDDFLAAYDRPRNVGLRLNPLKQTCADGYPVTGPVPWCPTGYYYDPAARPGLHAHHEAGAYYLQEPSAMAPASLLAPEPGMKVLDLCAAPGGKATQLAGMLQGQGLLVANEINPKRAKILSRNLERLAVANALCLNEHPKKLEERFPAFFDRIMVDAPCSGEGMFRKEEAAVTDWSQETVEMCARRQLEVLRSAAKMLAPGGRLVYSTCTFSPEENEGVIAAFLAEHGDFSIEQVPAPWFEKGRPEWVQDGPADLCHTFRLWPHKLRGEGHFAAVLRRADLGDRTVLPGPKTVAVPKELTAFLSDTGTALPEGPCMEFGGNLCVIPPDLPDLRGLKVLRAGLEIGQVQKNRFTPAHAWALWLKTAASVADFPADSPEISRYLRGESIPADQTGWTLITADGLSLGWAKGSDGQLKNHFPKGLRWV
jgi:16S rRNA C967 or C1407 C5-methylase (RsmB/RsmF family)/NOL1/NOP2/fmu family ribosome biogenesis protein